MWDSAGALSAFGDASVYVALGAALVAAFAGAAGAIASNRANAITTRQSNERIALADARAAEANLKTEELRQRFAWRRLSQEQGQKLLDGLHGFKAPLSLEYVKYDPETEVFRNDLESAFKQAGINPSFFRGWTKVLGTHVNGPPSQARDQLVAALKNADIPVDLVSENERAQDTTLRLIIGTRMSGLQERLTLLGPRG